MYRSNDKTTKKFNTIYELYTIYNGLSFRFRFTVDRKNRFFLNNNPVFSHHISGIIIYDQWSKRLQLSMVA